ncbi:YjcZ family sporulation protein [Virgibacillus kekensis]|uniref:YjcZ family sporulation protein n=1 Tax=Virgibacillus kekensis TaxID=202261 RepID=A0ABV9DNR9_9BACI
MSFFNNKNDFILLVVLFVLLVIIGSEFDKRSY